MVSHAYVEPGYCPMLSAMVAQPDFELALITPDTYRSRFHSAACQFSETAVGVHAYAVPVIFGRRQGAFIYQPAALSQALSEFRPDVLLHEQEVYAVGAAQIALMAAQSSIPLVMFVWENVHRSLSWPRRRLVRFVLERCSGLIGGSTGAVHVHRDWGFRGPMNVIPQMGAARLNPAPVYGRRSAKCFRVVFAGRLVAPKGVDCLLRAIAEVRGKGIGLACDIVGAGPELGKLVHLRHSLGIEDAVNFTGSLSIEGVRQVLARSDVLVLPSLKTPAWEEQFGRILVEAMAEATVTVGSRTGAIPEVIESEGLLFDENNYHQLAAILERLARNGAELAEHQHRLWSRAGALYTNEALAAQRLEFVTSICLAAKSLGPSTSNRSTPPKCRFGDLGALGQSNKL